MVRACFKSFVVRGLAICVIGGESCRPGPIQYSFLSDWTSLHVWYVDLQAQQFICIWTLFLRSVDLKGVWGIDAQYNHLIEVKLYNSLKLYRWRLCSDLETEEFA